MSVEIRLLELHVQDQTAVLLREGIIRPNDLVNGPTSPMTENKNNK